MSNCPDCTPLDSLYTATVCETSPPTSCVIYNGDAIPCIGINSTDTVNSIVTKLANGVCNSQTRIDDLEIEIDVLQTKVDTIVLNPIPTNIDLTALEAEIATKSTLPDGLSVIGNVNVSINDATISGFSAIYNGKSIVLPSAVITLDPKDVGVNRPSYDRIDTIYYNPATNTYGKVTGVVIENPVKPIPAIPNQTFRIADVRRNADGSNVITYASLNGFVTLSSPQSISALKNFNAGIGADKELLDVVKPINTFWQTGFYVNYENSFHNNTVLFVDDNESYFKKVIKIPTGANENFVHAIYGPYVDKLAPGDWVYEFRLKVGDNTINSDLIFFDIAVGGNTWTDHYLIIKGTDFPNTTDYKTFRVPFTATKGTGYEFRVRNLIIPNPTDIYFDYGIAKQAASADLISLDDLKDVDTTNSTDGQLLKKVNGKWIGAPETTGGGGNMLTSVYDTNSNGIVDNSEKLNGELASFYLSRSNHNGTQSAFTISDFQSAVTSNADVAANTAARHTHSNITALNAVTGINTGDQDLSGYTTTTSLNTAITSLKGGVPTNGDTLNKLYSLVTSAVSEVTVANIAARDAYNVTSLPLNVFVTDAGSGKWALYKATTTGTNATYVLLSNYDSVNSLQTASQIKTAYESNTDTNAFTDALKAKVVALTGTNTGDQTITLTGDVTGSGTGSFITTIGSGKVTNLMLAGSIDPTKINQDTTHRFFLDIERAKLAGIADGATANSSDAFLLNRLNHTGTQSADTLTDGTTNKAFLATERIKLAGIATGATVNSTDAFLLNRTNHTGTQNADTIVDGVNNKVFTTAYRDKLVSIQAGATLNSTDTFLLSRTNHTGTQSADTLTDGTINKAFTSTERTKLAGIATGATVNSADSVLLNRANHTGTQAATTIIGDTNNRFVTDVQISTWNGKQNAGDYATNTALNTGLSSKQPVLVSGTNLKTVNGTSLLGSGDIAITGGAGDMVRSVYDTNLNGLVDHAELADSAPWTGITGKPSTFTPSVHTHAESEIVGLVSDLAAKQSTLISGTNIKTINGASLLAAGDLSIPIINLQDNLTTTVAGSALDARQGNNLQNNKADKLGNSDIIITDSTKGFCLTSPNGNRWRITILNDGSFDTTII